MNYYIEKHDMEIILDALDHMRTTMEQRKLFGLNNLWPYSPNDVDGLFQSFDNSYVEK
jgi:hypothetical protein